MDKQLHWSRNSVKFFVGGAVIGVAVATTASWIRNKWQNKGKNCILLSDVWPFSSQKNNTYFAKPLSVHVITKHADFETCLPAFLQDVDKIKLVGIDCEWVTRNDKQRPVALLQLCSVSGQCLLIRMCRLTDALPPELVEALKNNNIIKVGVGPCDDAKKMFVDHGVIVRGCVDLRGLAHRDRYTGPMGLKNLAAKYLNIHMHKSKSVQCSNWEADVLTKNQIDYAAMDAAVAVHIFTKLLLKKMTSSQSDVENIILSSINQSVWSLATSCCQGLKDVNFKQRSNNHIKATQKMSIKNEMPLKISKSYSSRKFPLYDNCKLQAPDGQLLSTCDRKKATWYVEKGLADEVCSDPLTVRLKFEPSGRPKSVNDYYLKDKDNVCVVCGSTKSIVRKNIVPHEYRKHFPLVLKDHISHDILPVCVSCHQLAGFYDCNLRQRIADQYEAPLGSKQAVQLLEDPERRSVRSAGRALAGAKNKIPEPRKSELEQLVISFFEEDISDDLISRACSLETRYKNETYTPHGANVIAKILAKESIEGLVQFERRWRQHFIDAMQPKFLPDLWSVEHNHDRL